MNKFDVYSADNLAQITGYFKIGSLYLKPSERSNYSFPTNTDNMELEIFWTGASGNGKSAKFNIGFRNSTNLNINLLESKFDGDLPENPIAYVRTETAFEIYVKNFTDVNLYLDVKCKITQTRSGRFVPESSNFIENISSKNPTYYNPSLPKFKNSNIEDVDIKKIKNNNFYNGTQNTNTIQIPDYETTKRFLCRIYNLKSGLINEINCFIINGAITVKQKDETTMNATFSNGTITISGLEYYSYVYYELIQC